MSSSISSAQSNNRAGLCPHGLPPAACPICSSGTGAAKQVNMNDKPVTKPKSPAQWSFMKCYAVGLSMRAKEKRLQNIKNAFEQQVEFAKKLSNIIQNMADKFHTAIKNIQDNSPVFIYNTLQIITKLIIKPAFALISLIPLLIEKMAKFEQKMSVMINQAGEKLVSILGDIKNFINRKVFDGLKKEFKKLKYLFISYSEDEDENYKNDDTLAVFKSREIKKIAIKMYSILTKNKKEKKRNGNANRGIKNKTV